MANRNQHRRPQVGQARELHLQSGCRQSANGGKLRHGWAPVRRDRRSVLDYVGRVLFSELRQATRNYSHWKRTMASTPQRSSTATLASRTATGMKKKKKKAPPKLSRMRKPEEMSIEAWQRELRRQFGPEQPMELSRTTLSRARPSLAGRVRCYV